MVSSIAGDMKHQPNQTHQYNLQPQRILKKPLNSLPSGPKQPKVYKVKPIHFRELVQKLTGAPLQSQTRRSSLQSVAPPPLPLHPHQLRVQNQTQTETNIVKQEVVPYKVEQPLLPASLEQQKSFLDKMEDGDGLTELTLSPNFQSWFAFAMLSPGAATVSQLEQSSAV